MIYYTIVRILTYIICSILAVFIAVGAYKTNKVSDKICGILFLTILLMRMLNIR